MKELSTLNLIVISPEMLRQKRRYFPIHTFFEAVSGSSYQSCLTSDFFDLCNKLGMLYI